jgi:hypothetical protein
VGEMVVHLLILTVKLPHTETLLPLIQRFVSDALDGLSEQFLLILWHYLK